MLIMKGWRRPASCINESIMYRMKYASAAWPEASAPLPMILLRTYEQCKWRGIGDQRHCRVGQQQFHAVRLMNHIVLDLLHSRFNAALWRLAFLCDFQLCCM